jgi:co-chaperonin GroES (HSP10)
MKPLNKRVIVQIEKRINDKVNVGGFEWELDTAFRQFYHAVQKVTVVAAADGCDVENGDDVYVHHFVADRENQLPFKGGHFSYLEYNNVYCKVKDGEIIMLSDWILVEPVTADNEQFYDKSEYGLILSTRQGSDYLDRVGIVRHLSQSAVDAGLKEGDKVLFGKNCEYDIKIEGTVYFRMELRDVITVLDDEVRIQNII